VRGGEKIATCTINIDGINLEKNEVIIKDYGENEGMFKSLIKAEVIKDTGKAIEQDYGTHTLLHPIGELIKE